MSGAPTPGAPEKAAVRRMFDQIAPRYDVLNRLLSAGSDVSWRRKAVQALELNGAGRVLDLCCGTGDVLREVLERNPQHTGVGVDLSERMLELGRGKLRRLAASLCSGDVERLPFRDASFDAAVVAFGIRNVGEPRVALTEVLRVLRPGGRLVVLEFAPPEGVLGRLFRLYFEHVLPRVGGWLSGSREAYAYLPASVQRFATPDSFRFLMARAGFRVRPPQRLTAGIAYVYCGDKLMIPAPDHAETLKKVVGYLVPHREALLESWISALAPLSEAPEEEVRRYCTTTLDRLLERLAVGAVESLLENEAAAAGEATRVGHSFKPIALAIRMLDRCCVPHLVEGCESREELAECLLALDELADRRLELLLGAQEEEMARRLIEAEETASRAQERSRQLTGLNTELQRAQAQSRHRADQIGLLNEVTKRVAAVLDPEELLQSAADSIQGRLGHTYVAVVVLDDDGVLVGRWAGREGVGRRSSGPTQNPAGGVIGRVIRKRAPQVVADVSRDPDYHADVAGTCSEMAVPLIDAGEVVGVIDFQSEREDAFDLDDVAAAEAVAEFLVVALRNARLYAEARRARGAAG